MTIIQGSVFCTKCTSLDMYAFYVLIHSQNGNFNNLKNSKATAEANSEENEHCQEL